jgi:hypothetical protein
MCTSTLYNSQLMYNYTKNYSDYYSCMMITAMDD